MSTYYMVLDEPNIQDIDKEGDFHYGVSDTLPKGLPLHELLHQDPDGTGFGPYFNIYDIETGNYVWVDCDDDGTIRGFTRFGANNPDFMIDLVDCIDEYTISEIYEEFVDENGDFDQDEANEFIRRNGHDYTTDKY